MQPRDRRAFRVLFVCTGNSARSQMAEALLNRKGRGRFVAESAGSEPAAQVNPHALAALREAGVEWAGRPPRGLEAVRDEPWDFVITVCDRAREACPLFPGRPVLAHWGVPDPAAVAGGEEEKRAAFRDALAVLARRIDLLLALPVEKLRRVAFENELHTIGGAHAVPGAGAAGDAGGAEPTHRPPPPPPPPCR